MVSLVGLYPTQHGKIPQSRGEFSRVKIFSDFEVGITLMNIKSTYVRISNSAIVNVMSFGASAKI